MPHYDYVCAQCGHQKEIFQKITEQALINCPNCQQATFKRKWSGGMGLQFQGSGFYCTDYENKKGSSPSMEKATPVANSCGCGQPACKK